MTATRISATTLALMLAAASAAFAQQRNTQGMNMQDHGMGGMDMQTMMNQCAQMRRQMKPGARMTPDMQRMMTQCDQMDRRMGATSGGAPPATRNR
jgi:hypothetical protein